MIWITMHEDDQGRMFWAVSVDGLQVSSFWRRGEAIKDARRIAGATGLRLWSAPVVELAQARKAG